MIRPARPLTIDASASPPRYAVQPKWAGAFAILDNGEAVAWATSQPLAQRIADFLNWRHQLDASEQRYREAFLHA